MRFSLSFIKDSLDINIEPKKLVEVLTMAGMEVEHFEKIDNDWVFDIEVTTNRYDWLSIVGIANEIAAVTHKKLNIPKIKLIKSPAMKEKKIVIEDLKDCPYYIGRIIKGISMAESPKWLKEKVDHCGVSLISNCVDITNYCMLKWGNPLHAFDLDKLEGDVYIRRAKNKEKFIGIDDKERELSTDNLVIADQKKVIALAGVIGGKNTEVDQNTKNIFLEAAIFSPLTVRKSRKAAGLDTDSSYRFERMVHPDCLEYASQEASDLIEKIAQGKFSGYKASGKKPANKRNSVTVSLKHLNAYLGVDFSSTQVKKILSNLGFSTAKSSKEKMTFLSPQLRLDIKRDVDIYEEVSRIYGYNNIKNTLPFLLTCEKRNLKTNDLGKLYDFKNDIRKFIASLGLKEIITYSLDSSEDLAKLGQKDLITLSNPMRSQENVLRPSLLLSMIKASVRNLNRNQSDLKFFELGNSYRTTTKDFTESSNLAFSLTGKIDEFFYLKKTVCDLLNFINQPNIEFKVSQKENFTNALAISLNNQELGFLGKLDQSIKKEFDIKEDLFFAEFDLYTLLNLKSEKFYKPFSPYPAVFRDISLAIEKSKNFSQVEKIIKEKGSNIVEIIVIDTYKGKGLPDGSTGLTVRVYYQSFEATLVSAEVDSIHNLIREALSCEEGITLR